MKTDADQKVKSWAGLLRAVNVGGTGKLPMTELKAMCEEIGFEQLRTYIASGNVIFKCEGDEAEVKERLEDRLEDYAGKRVDVMVRSLAEIEQVLSDDPFQDEEGNRVAMMFFDQPPPDDLAERATGLDNERIELGRREVYVHFPDGMGRSKLKLPPSGPVTTRNRNTVSKLGEMMRENSLP